MLVVEVLCLPEQREELLHMVRKTVAGTEKRQQPGQGAWRTTGVRLRPPRGSEEAEWLRETLHQADDANDRDRDAMVLEVAGRGSRPNFDEFGDAIRLGLCPDDFHDGPCPIPWATMCLDLKDVGRQERLTYRELFPAGRRRNGPS